MNKFKASNGVYLLKVLFVENDPTKMTAVYTLKDEDHTVDNRVFPSLRRLFVESEDLTEYLFAETHLGGWGHWCKLKECSWFPYHQWREELEVRVKSKALRNVQDIVRDNKHKDNLQASKFILQDGWKKKERVGRTTKEKIKQEANSLFKEKSETAEDLERLKNV
jgi:hypothetical protein